KPINYKVDRFSPNLKKGLSTAQVQTRFKQFLFNDTNKKYSRSYASIFIGNICTFFNLLCLLAGIALLIANTQGFTNYLVIFITTANIVIGIIQEIRSKLSIDKLSILAVNTVKVVRDGEVVETPTNEIVLDDVIILELGNQVPADCILAEGSVEVNESLLTGESVAIKKQVGDILYAGSFISSGSGKCRVEKVGRATYLEKLTSKAKKYKRPNSELMNSTKLIIKFISILIIPIAIGMFIVCYRCVQDPNFATKYPALYDFFINSVSAGIFNENVNFSIQRTCTVVIGMIPSGMLLLTSIALAVGIVRLAKNHTLVQDMYSLEMLARVNVLCLDKTGTITDGRMKVNDCVILNTVADYSLNDVMGSMLKALDSNNQTSIALTNHFGFNDILTPVTTIPFSSKIKLSAATFEDAGTFVMGAPEFVLKPYPAKVEKIVKQYAQMGLRVIVLAHSPSPIVGEKLPAVLKPIAVISIADNIREDAIETIKWFGENDVNVKVISGDNPITVCEVAKRAGIKNADKFISLEGLNEKEVSNVANKYTVFGRVTPEQKAILVRSIKAEGNTVAMTGDGVNDILAMKEADCAISVASGSEAARNVSHIVLMDNNFNSMPKVVAEGRRVINNIKNSSSLFLMKTLFTAFLAIICLCMQAPYLFMPQNVLLLEFCIIAIPSFFLSLQPNKERVQGKFITHVLSRSFSGALLMFICVMAMYLTNVIDTNINHGTEFSDYYLPMCMIALTFSGLVMVYRVCKPLNAYRAILCLSMLGLCIAAFAVKPITEKLLYTGWTYLKWDYSKILIIVVVIEAAFPVSNWLIKLMQVIMPSASNTVKPRHNKHTANQTQQTPPPAPPAPPAE
ncbi:MAG: HAD-IC family P-type ATPase, partial [Clostridia bacterium]|nr:HAD-IC family P-type ATPase [Clostridia bacterium]